MAFYIRQQSLRHHFEPHEVPFVKNRSAGLRRENRFTENW